MLRFGLFALALCVPLRGAAAADLAKIAIVIVGDPDATLQDAARQLQDALTASGLSVPTDAALQSALKGIPSETDDGLDGVRAHRRALGLSDRKDTELLVRLGQIAGAHALVVVRTDKVRPAAEVFDVGAARFYDGVLDLSATTASAQEAFVRARATAAARRSYKPEQAEPAGGTVKSTLAPAVDTPEPKKRRWIKKNWPYVLGGALLLGTVTYFVVNSQRGGAGQNPPVLRFRPGDS